MDYLLVMVLILDIILAIVVFGITAICAAPVVFYMAPRARWLSKVLLSSVFGFAIIIIAGALSVLLGVSPMMLQGGIVLLGVILFLRDWKKIVGPGDTRLDREDWIALAITSLYLLLCLFYFDRIIIWMGGDALAHAEIIRMLLDGRPVPVSIPPLGSYWEYYPKGFHLFCYLWARVFPLLDVVRTIPVLITAITTMLLYSIVREMGRRDVAVYALLLACFVFSAHYSNLIWAGYPTITAEMFLVASLLAVPVDRRLLPVFLLGVLFGHARLLALAGGVLLLWMAAIHSGRCCHFVRQRSAAKIIIAAVAAGMVAVLAHVAHGPQFLTSVLSDQSLASAYAARWYPAFLSLFGAVIAFIRRDRMDHLALTWAAAIVLIMLLADVGPLGFVGTADRLLLGLYLPLSLLAAIALSKMDGASLQVRAGFMIILALCGILAMFAVFHSFAGSWGLPQEDYRAIKWLEEQNYSDAVCINLDETGAWVYPIAGIGVANSRMWTASAPFDPGLIPRIIADPGNPDVVNALGSFSPARCLIYISNVSLSRPGYVPPFAEYLQAYPVVNLSYPEDRYDLIYHNGTYIFGFPKGAFV
ncbi:MAG: hypothetical protein LUQ59_00865 [Methanothrix sp.]|nr:hypothetical protein [Methanothrix sp.]